MRSLAGRFFATADVTTPMPVPTLSAAVVDTVGPTVTCVSGTITALLVALTASATTATPLSTPVKIRPAAETGSRRTRS